MFWRKKKTPPKQETTGDCWDSRKGRASLARMHDTFPALAAEVERGRDRANSIPEDDPEEEEFLAESPVKANPDDFRPATLAEYRDWLREWLRNGYKPTRYLDRPFNTAGMVVAVQDFFLRGAYGANSVKILVPKGVTYRGGEPGHCTVYLPGGETARGHFSANVPLYNDAELMGLPGMREFAEEELREHEEKLRKRESEFRHIRRRWLDQGDDDGPTPTPLHAYQVTANDAALLRKMAGARFGEGATITLPSGKVVTGAEMRKWAEAQDWP